MLHEVAFIPRGHLPSTVLSIGACAGAVLTHAVTRAGASERAPAAIATPAMTMVPTSHGAMRAGAAKGESFRSRCPVPNQVWAGLGAAGSAADNANATACLNAVNAYVALAEEVTIGMGPGGSPMRVGA